MKQLNIQDAGFIYQETESTPMHIGGLGIYNQSAKAPIRSKKDITEYLSARIHIAPIMKQKLHHVPGEWDRPFWVRDNEFKIDNHVHHIGLPNLGNISQLNELVSNIISQPLDMSRPLWEVYFIEGLNIDGLAKNSFAILTKIHHSCIDGASGANIIGAMHDLTTNAQAMPTPANDDEGEAVKLPGRYESLARAYASNVISSYEQSVSVSKRLPSLIKTVSQLYRGERKAGAKLKVPATRFNKTPGKSRLFASSQYSLDKIKAIKNAVPGTTVNDVMVAIIAGALRNYLAHHGELPDLPLGAMLPQNVRSESNESDKHGNVVSGLFATIHTDIEDSVERLQAIHESVNEAKVFSNEENLAAIFPNLMGGFLYPKAGKALTRMNQHFHIMERLGPVVLNTVITNVPGPDFPLYHDGAEMVSYAGIPPLTDGVGISHAIYSYCGKISLAMVTCGGMMDDPEFYMQCCDVAYNELLEKTGNTQQELAEVASA